jgi:DNA-directed RNA polymerase I subunit RPA43
MSATAGGSSQDAIVASSQKTEKKHKRTKSDHKKKRAREDDDAAVVEETPRKSKKTKSVGVDNRAAPPEEPDNSAGEPSKKKKKQKRFDGDEEEQDGPAQPPATPRQERKKSSKRAKDAVPSIAEPMDVDPPETAPVEEDRKSDKKRKERRSKKQKAEEDEDMDEDPAEADSGADRKKRKNKDKPKESSNTGTQGTQESAAAAPADSDFPFFTQAISLYVPFFPVGFDKPLTNVAAQHLDPLLNHYSPLLRGVLLSYSNLNLSDRPAKASVTHPPTDQTPALLHSIDEYAVGFGWLTFDAQLFVPSRGKWMEGVVQLQSEGHIGVVCWNKFNASIEAKRLPQGWTWVDLAKGGPKPIASPIPDENEEEEHQEEEDILDGEELQVVEQIHTTGYWVNENGKKLGGKLRFRIKNFDVGLAGDYGYLSIEGTCLDDDAERALAAQERSMEQARRAKQNPGGLLRPLSRRVPEFSMTKFGREDEEEDDGQRTVLYKGSRPGTPDD